MSWADVHTGQRQYLDVGIGWGQRGCRRRNCVNRRFRVQSHRLVALFGCWQAAIQSKPSCCVTNTLVVPFLATAMCASAAAVAAHLA